MEIRVSGHQVKTGAALQEHANDRLEDRYRNPHPDVPHDPAEVVVLVERVHRPGAELQHDDLEPEGAADGQPVALQPEGGRGVRIVPPEGAAVTIDGEPLDLSQLGSRLELKLGAVAARRPGGEVNEKLRRRFAAEITARTGLLADPYFSGTKLRWILEEVDGARARAEAGELLFGTIDSYLIWKLTGGREHVIDRTNASRTLLFDIHRQRWDPELLELFDIPESLLPEVRDSACDFGSTDSGLLGEALPIRAMAGDQQSALVGQAGFAPGMTKSTYGTGCFVITNTGETALESKNQLLTTIGWRLDGATTYALEDSIFVAGSALQWLRDELGILDAAPASEAIAERTGIVDNVQVVPAFAGLGAPYWDADARGAILGLSRDTTREQIVTATLQAVACQTRDLFEAMADDGIAVDTLRVDGGMAANGWFLQFLADLLGVPVERPVNTESTVLGAACLAGLAAGFYADFDELAALWQRDAGFEPSMSAEQRGALYAGWQKAVRRVRSMTD